MGEGGVVEGPTSATRMSKNQVKRVIGQGESVLPLFERGQGRDRSGESKPYNKGWTGMFIHST